MDRATTDQANERVLRFLKEKFPFGGSQEITNQTSLLDSGIVDSMGVLDLVTFIEEQFGIVADDDDLVAENFETIEAIVSFIESRK